MSGYPERKRRRRDLNGALEDTPQRDAARNGRKAERLLVKYIQNHERSTAWIVEEINEHPYHQTGAKLKAGMEKPDVILYETQSLKDYGLISLKCCGDFRKGFNQIKRTSLKKFGEEFEAPEKIQGILRRYSFGKKKLTLTGRNYTQGELDELRLFLNSHRKSLLLSAFTGQAKKSKANWLLLHQWTPPNWESNVAKKERSELISMLEVMQIFNGLPVGYTRLGTITFGAGITLQRKGGDKGKDTANDLQFKMRTWPFLKALGRC